MAKRRTKKHQQRTVRAAAKRAGKPGGKSRYALKKLEQRRGHFRPTSPFVAVRVTKQFQIDELPPLEGEAT